MRTMCTASACLCYGHIGTRAYSYGRTRELFCVRGALVWIGAWTALCDTRLHGQGQQELCAAVITGWCSLSPWQHFFVRHSNEALLCFGLFLHACCTRVAVQSVCVDFCAL